MKRLALAAALLCSISSQAAAQDFAVTGATVALGDGSEPIENGTVVIRDGKVVGAGSDVVFTQDIPVIDGKGLWVTPGLFASLTDIGIFDVQAEDASNDVSADNAVFSAALDIAPVVNPLAQQVKNARRHGVTRASVAPWIGNSIFAGQGAAIDLGADPDPITFARAFQFVELGEDGGAAAGGSRAAAHVLLTNALAEAQDLASHPERNSDALLNRPDATALIPVVEGKQKLYVHVERAIDILSTLKLMESHPQLDLVLVGASEGWLVAERIAAAGVPVIAEPLGALPKSFETLAATESNVGRMVEAGVKVAVGRFADPNTDPDYYPGQQAGNLVAIDRLPGATGLGWGAALAAITSVPAEIAGVGGQYGVLKPGAVGDLVLWDGDPLEVRSAPVRVFIDGIEQPLDTHQTRLRERYTTPTEGALPKAYEW